MQIEVSCHRCRHKNLVSASSHCSSCNADLFRYPTEKFVNTSELDQCPVCGCIHLYRQKDFNRNLGIVLVVLGIALAYFTYGVSLLVVTLLDWWLYRRVKEIVLCYQCKTIFRDYASTRSIDPFNLVLHDYYKNLPTVR